MNDFTMTVTIQTPWTYELFNEAMLTFEHSLNRTIHVRCAHDTTTMLENIATWAKSRGHSVLTIDKDRMLVTVKKKPKKTTGGYQPEVNTPKPNPPTSGSNAVKSTAKVATTCNNCGRAANCPKAKHIENYRLKSECLNFISEETQAAVKHNVCTYEDLAANIHRLSPDQEWELISLYRNYVDRMEDSWNARYTYCTGCHKTVRRDNTYTELTPDGRQLIKCKSCDVIWYVK